MEHVFLVKSTILKCVPDCNLIEENAGSLIFSIPPNKIAESKDFFKLLNNVNVQTTKRAHDDRPEIIATPNSTIGIDDIKHLVKDCGISHTTLEEVFLKVTKNDNPK